MTSSRTTSTAVKVYAGTNILKPIRYPVAANHLQAKFSLPAALAMIALARKAGKREFSDEFVGSAPMQAMQRQITTELDPEIEKMGFDKMRSRIAIRLKERPQRRRLGRRALPRRPGKPAERCGSGSQSAVVLRRRARR